MRCKVKKICTPLKCTFLRLPLSKQRYAIKYEMSNYSYKFIQVCRILPNVDCLYQLKREAPFLYIKKTLLLKLYYTSVTCQCSIRSRDSFALNVDNYENLNLSQTAPTAFGYDTTILPKHTPERNNI